MRLLHVINSKFLHTDDMGTCGINAVGDRVRVSAPKILQNQRGQRPSAPSGVADYVSRCGEGTVLHENVARAIIAEC